MTVQVGDGFRSVIRSIQEVNVSQLSNGSTSNTTVNAVVIAKTVVVRNGAFNTASTVNPVEVQAWMTSTTNLRMLTNSTGVAQATDCRATIVEFY